MLCPESGCHVTATGSLQTFKIGRQLISAMEWAALADHAPDGIDTTVMAAHIFSKPIVQQGKRVLYQNRFVGCQVMLLQVMLLMGPVIDAERHYIGEIVVTAMVG